MFLTPQKINDLDYILNTFEVAYRSVITDILLNKYPSTNEFENKINELNRIYNSKVSDGVVPAQFLKYVSKIKKYSSKKNIDETYEILSYCINALMNKDYREDRVFYISELIDLILLFYNPLFEGLGSKFGRIEDYEDHLRNYLTLRNSASHPASSKISIHDTQEVIRFIVLSLEQIEEKYFWYIPKNEIFENCSKLLMEIDNKEKVKNNINGVAKKHKNLIERDKELKKLKELLIGEGKIKRTAGSIVLHGSGGVGKTALALEFCYDIILQSLDEPAKTFYDFILWVSSKEEELSFDHIIGSLHINKLLPQFNSLEELISSLGSLFDKNFTNIEECIEFLEDKKGIIILDNYETIQTNEKIKINDFIKMCPRQIQFIITSRTIEEIAEASIPLVGFEFENGKIFIKKYCEDNFYNAEFEDRLIREFIKETCGNPLIIVLSLGRIIEGLIEMDEIIGYLRNYSTTEVETLADFMYKNMLEEIIGSVREEKNCDVENILNIMLLYEEPIDLYSLRDLTEVDTKELEDILATLGNKLIVSKQKGFYKLNELAIKFVLIKTLPNSITLKSLITKIHDYKKKIDSDLEKLARDKAMFPILQSIIDDWQPISHPEQIAMAQAYNAHARLKKKLKDNPKIEYIKELINSVEYEFMVIKQRSNHPYIKFQHSRVLKLLLCYQKILKENGLLEKLIHSIKESYSEAYTEIWTRYRHIIKTKSFPAFLMQYGNFLLDNGESEEAFKLLERCVYLYETKFYDETMNLINSYYYLSQAAIVCAKKDTQHSNEYLLCCKKSVTNALKLLPDFKKKVSAYQVEDLERKEKILSLINIVTLLMSKAVLYKEQIKFNYEKSNKVKMPYSLRWIDYEIKKYLKA